MAEIDIKKIKKHLSQILKKYDIKAKRVVIFGSYIRKNKVPNDVDIGIISGDFKDKDFWERAEIIGNIHWELVNILDVSLDIVGISPQEWKKDSGIISYIKEGRVII